MELFSPQKVDPLNADQGMSAVEVERPLPWEPGHAIERRTIRRGLVWQHTVYAGIFDVGRMREVLRQVFGADERDQDFDGRHAGDSALLSFTVNQDGLLLMESPMLSSCAWAVGRALSPGPRDPAWLDGFEKDAEECLGRLLHLADGRLSVMAATGARGISRSALGAIAGVAANVVLGAATGGVGVLASAASNALGSIWGPVAAGAIQKSGEGIADAAVGKAKDSVLRRTGAAPGAPNTGADTAAEPPALLGSVPLDVHGLAAVVRWVAEELGVADALLPDAIRVKSHQVSSSRAEEAEQQDFLNSFIAEDLSRVAESLASGTSGGALEEYLRPDSSLPRSARTDVRQQPPVLLEGVRPAAAPLGRWPADPKHPLTLSQQFAVNTALAELGADDARGVYAVNGPPGTGKTTMLRDFVAALVVRRAERLAGQSRARDAFGSAVAWTVDGHKRVIHPPIAELTGFEMVIASANNGAVENVTTEVPSADAIHREWRATADYLSQPASLLLGAPAWGAVAARLGNRGNRSEFKERFWWGEEKLARIPGQRSATTQRTGQGLHDLLRRTRDLQRGVDTDTDALEPTEPLGAYSWAEARQRFVRARERVQQLGARREEAARALSRLAEAESRLEVARAAAEAARQRVSPAEVALREFEALAAEAETMRTQAQAALQAANTALDEAERGSALARDLCAAAATELNSHDHRNAPGRLRRTLAPESVERWQRGRQPHVAAVQAREAAWHDAEERVRRARDHVAACATRSQTGQALLDRARRAVTDQQRAVRDAENAAIAADERVAHESAARQADQRLVSRAHREWHTSVPGAEWDAPASDRTAAETREKSAPWMDEEFARARSDLFLAALDLHRALLCAEPELVRKSMLNAMDVISGSAPKDLGPRQVQAAWQLLFLIVPVVSTTFASLDRMFTGLGAEALGWLFVDEAGQAAPQQVVGALWRARRAVVVGDPLQLEPVVALPWTAQQKLREHFGVAEEWAPARTSVQRLSDRLARYGTTLPGPDGDPVWVGSPLRVHRRCDRLMFDVSNAVAYDGMMVFGTGEREAYPTVNRNIWLHVEATEARGKWIPEEGRVLARCLDLMADRLRGALLDERTTAGSDTAPEWDQPQGDGDPLEDELRRRLAQTVFVVSPFREVVSGVQQITASRLPRKAKRVGTVHTTQGKEADVVILVLGTKPDQNGSRDWASQTPNLLNVAVSRARRRLIVIGDHTAWSGHRYFSTLANHPELYLKDSTSWPGR